MIEQSFEQEKLEKAFEKAYDEKQTELEKIGAQKLVISLIGSVNSGKSQTINALTGKEFAVVKALAGSTQEVQLYPLTENVLIADTPGLDDINEKVSKKASEFVKKDSDIILFFMNAAAGVTKHDKEAFEEVSRLRKETIIVLNKIDTLDEDDLEDVINQIKGELKVIPIAISAKKRINMSELNDKILSILEAKGKDLLFLKLSQYKEETVTKWVNGASVTAAGIGALPIPGSDIIPLTTLQVGLAMKIAYIYDIKPSKNDVMKLVASTVTGSIGKQIAKWAITAIKAAGWIPGAQLLELAVLGIAATVAASLTYGFGWASNAYYRSGMAMDMGEVGEIFKNSYDEYKNRADDKSRVQGGVQDGNNA